MRVRNSVHICTTTLPQKGDVGGRWGLDTLSTQYRRGYRKGGSVQFILSIGNHPDGTPHRQPPNGDAVPVLRKNEMTKTTTTINSAFTTYIKADDKARAALAAAKTALVAALAAAGITNREQAYPVATEWAAKAYACETKDGERKAAGTKVLDKDHANYESARKARTRVLSVFEAEAASVQKTESAPTENPATEAQKALFVAFMGASVSKAQGAAVFAALLKQFKG